MTQQSRLVGLSRWRIQFNLTHATLLVNDGRAPAQYKHLKGALELRNGCGHPTGYQPDPVKLQAYYADITQLVLLNPKFT